MGLASSTTTGRQGTSGSCVGEGGGKEQVGNKRKKRGTRNQVEQDTICVIGLKVATAITCFVGSATW